MKLIETETNKVVAIVVENPKTKEFEFEIVDTENHILKDGDVYIKSGEQDQVAFILGDEIVYKTGKYDCVNID